MTTISQSFREVSEMRIRELDAMDRIDFSYPLIEKAIHSVGNKICGLAYDPMEMDDWVVTVNGATRPAVNEASWVLGADLLLVVLHRAGKAVSAGALQIAESGLTPEELDFCSCLRQNFVLSGYIKA